VGIDGLLVKDAGIPQAAVTAHEAALAILLGQLTDGIDLTERNVAESIVALWEFAHASGLKTDIITERTADAGVTLDGVLLKDGGIDLAGDIEFSSRDALLALGNNHDVPTGTVTVQRLTRDGGGSDITGFAGGREGRMIIVVNLGAGGMTLFHDNAGSAVANRLYNPDGASVVMGTSEQVSYFYDSTTQRWRLFGNGT